MDIIFSKGPTVSLLQDMLMAHSNSVYRKCQSIPHFSASHTKFKILENYYILHMYFSYVYHIAVKITNILL